MLLVTSRKFTQKKFFSYCCTWNERILSEKLIKIGGSRKIKLLSQTDLKSSWAPVYKLNGPLSLDSSNGSVDILGYNITSIQ